MKSIIQSVFLFSLLLSYKAQSQKFGELRSDPQHTVYHSFNLGTRSVDGTSYINDNWVNGSISLSSQQSLTFDSMHYDVYLNKIIFKDKKGTYYIPQEIGIEKLTLNNKLYKLKKINKTDKPEFVEIIFENDQFSLFKQYHCKFIEGSTSNGMLPAVKDKFIVSTDYFLKDGDNDFEKLKLRRKEFESLNGKNSKEIHNYIKDNNLSMRDEGDIINILNFISSM